MNYFILLARLFLVLYSVFLLLFAFGEGITGEGFMHIFPPVLVSLILIFLWDKYFLSALTTSMLFGVSIWFYGTYNQLVPFMVVSLPWLIAGVLFLLGTRKNPNLNSQKRTE